MGGTRLLATLASLYYVASFGPDSTVLRPTVGGMVLGAELSATRRALSYLFPRLGLFEVLVGDVYKGNIEVVPGSYVASAGCPFQDFKGEVGAGYWPCLGVHSLCSIVLHLQSTGPILLW